jgi:ketosteroid isomerase-like protein
VASRQNVEVVLQVIAAINQRDSEAALSVLSEDAEYVDHRPSSREEFRGHEAFRRHFSEIWESAPDVHIAPEVAAHPGDLVVVRQSVSATDASGRPTTSVRWVTRAVREGLISRVEVFDSEREALEAAGLSE